ncbi:MAG: response regulator [Caulobacteraceae bacterium]|nr:response regulator [Caulobacteraceae bacterium]
MVENRARRVLIADDETLITMLIQDMLSDLGFETVGPAHQLTEALSLAEESAFDCAILDLNMNGRSTTPVAEILLARGVPFAFASGYAVSDLGPAFEDVPVLQKPFDATDLAEILDQLLGFRADAAADN